MDQTLRSRLEALLPVVRERRDEIERARRLPQDLVEGFRDTGVFALEIPRSLGGAEASPIEILEALETAARADGSTGWCIALGVANNGVVGCMTEDGARAVFPDPTAPTAGVFAPAGKAERVPGGVRVDGRWPFASGIPHCDWIWLGCIVTEGGRPRMTEHGPEIVHVYVPKSEITVHDTWFVSGLAGTASNDVSAERVFVPEERIFSVGSPAAWVDGFLYRMPPLAWFASHVAAVCLGLARGALDELIAIADTKVPTFSRAVVAERPLAQAEIARAEATLGAARAFVRAAVDDAWQALRQGEEPTPRQVADIRVAAANATDVGAAVTRTCSTLAGGSAIFNQSPFQRHMRDAEAIAHHFTVSPYVWEDAGRVYLGRAPTAPMF